MKNIFLISLVVFVLGACSEEGSHGHGKKVSEKEYAKNGVLVMGKITERVKKKQVKDQKKRDYYLRYSFQPEGGGKTTSSQQKVTKSIWKQVHKGEPVEVQYIEGKPKNSRLTLDEF